MKPLAKIFVSGTMALVFCVAASAQARYQEPYYDRDRYGQDRYSQPRGYGYGRNQQSIVGRVLSDLNRASSGAYLDGHERRHVEEAAEKLQEFDARLSRGNFDTGKLDKAIDNLKHLTEADRVRPRDREMLARDLQDLRQFRATRGRYER